MKDEHHPMCDIDLDAIASQTHRNWARYIVGACQGAGERDNVVSTTSARKGLQIAIDPVQLEGREGGWRLYVDCAMDVGIVRDVLQPVHVSLALRRYLPEELVAMAVAGVFVEICLAFASGGSFRYHCVDGGCVASGVSIVGH